MLYEQYEVFASCHLQ